MADARVNQKISLKRKSKTPTNEKSEKEKRRNIQVEDDEEDFPRGGTNTLTPLEVRRVKDEAEKDILFGTLASHGHKKTPNTKSKRKNLKPIDYDKSTNKNLTPVTKKIRTVESLSFKKLSKGDLLLGIVQEVFDFELLVHLPNSLSGCVPITNINKDFTSQLDEETTDNEDDEHNGLTKLQKFFPVGTIVRCVVLSKDSSKRGYSKIRLSVDPTDVNVSLTSTVIKPNMVLSGYVTSMEDHGYAVSLGIAGVSGFISKKNAPGELSIGQVVDCLVIATSSDKRLVQLQCDKNKISSACVSKVEKIVFSSLLPGMLVKATVKTVINNGLAVTFLGGFDGSLDIIHLKDNGCSGDDIEETYPLKRKIMCRIIFICPSMKIVGLSELQNLIENEAFSFPGVSISDVVEEATVMRFEEGRGVLLQLSDKVLGYAHVSRLSDEPLTKIEKKFKAGTKHSCRILNLNTLVGLALVTLQKSVIEEPFIRYQDIKPGDIVTGQVQCLLESGMLVSLSDHIRGFCPALHYADIPLKHPEKKLHEGKTLKCRVLDVQPERKRLHVTHKKTLVNSELTPITNYSDIELGMKTHGFITSIKDYGCIVRFYNNVYGLVPKIELGLNASENPANVFYVGQVVTCFVMACDTTNQRLALSFKTTGKPSSLNTKSLTQGMLVDVDIVGKADSGLDVQIKPSNTPAFLSRIHLSDHVTHCGPLLEMFSPFSAGEGSEVKSLSNVLYYGSLKDRTHVISRKQSLIKMATEGSVMKKIEDLKVGMILPGFTRNFMPYGIFIEFSPNVYGLAPNSFLSNTYVADASRHFQLGQSVVAKIIEIDCERRRFLVSLKPSDCFPKGDEDGGTNTVGVDLLQERIHERDEILEYLQSKQAKHDSSLLNILLGSLVTAKVTAVENYGVSLLLENGVEGFAPPQLVKGIDTSVGEVFDVLVLDYDIERKRVYVTADSNTIREQKETIIKVKKKIKTGVVVPVTVQIIHSEYMVVLLPKHRFRVAYVPVKAHLNDIRDPASRFNVGQTCEATVQRYVKSKLDKRKYLIVSVSNSEETRETIKPGEIVTGIVKSIKDIQINVTMLGGLYHGRVHVTEILDDPEEGSNPLTLYKCGDKIQVKVLGFRDSKDHNFLPITHRNFTHAAAELSTRSSRFSRLLEDDDKSKNAIEKKLAEYKEGEKILCFIKKVGKSSIWMSASTSVDGRVTLLDISTDVKVLQNLSSHFKVGTAHRCTVFSLNEDHKSLDLSMLGCVVEKGNVVPGIVRRIFRTNGLAVHLQRKKNGMVFLTDVSDKFQENPLDGYSMNQLVSCYVLTIKDGDQIELSTRASKTGGTTTEVNGSENDKDVQSISDINEGDIVRGYIKSSSDVGVFVSLSKHVVARVQIKNLSHYFIKKWKPFFPVGKLVKGKVLSINPSSNFIELSLKGKDVGGEDPVPKSARSKRKNKKGSETNSKRTHSGSEREDDDEGTSVKKLRKDDEVKEESDSEQDSQSSSSKDSSDDDNEKDADEDTKPRLKLPGGFDWNSFKDEDLPTFAEGAAADSDSDDTSEVDENNQIARKKSKRAKRSAKKAEEEFLYKTEKDLLNQDKCPQTTEDFDRVLLATPNDSLLWLQYMAFNLQLTEIDKARAVAERALKSISFRKECEKFNVWAAFLNLENSYGTQDSLLKVFERALEQNEPKKVFKQLINIYINSNKFESAEQLYQTMVKRFKSSKKVWVEYMTYLMEHGEVESARDVMQRSFKSLEKRKHIETITTFALLEFKHGEPERGRTLLDNVLTSYPKRTDIWSMYVDVLTKIGDIAAARRLLERAATLKLSSRKIKFIFKKYLEFEKKHGDESSVESVKTMAEEYAREKNG